MRPDAFLTGKPKSAALATAIAPEAGLTTPPATTTVIVLNFNGRDDLADCLESLRSLAAGGSTRVLVADNGSTDGSVEWLRSAQPWVDVLELGQNWGFALGMNRAVASIETPYFALLNNDTEVEPGWLGPLVEALESDPTVAAVQARIMFHDRRSLIQSAGGGLTRDGYGYDEGYSRRVRAPFDRRREVMFASAGAALYRRAAWLDVGPFDPAYFMYHEDVDWSWRAWLAGWRVLYEPAAVVYHKLGATTSKVLGFPARQALGERHRIRTLLKLGAMPRALKRVHGGLRTRDWARVRLLMRCVLWNLWHLPGTLSLRWRAPVRVKRRSIEERIGKSASVPGLTASYRPVTVATLASRLGVGASRPTEGLSAGAGDEGWLGPGWYEPGPVGRDGVCARFMVEEAELFALAGPEAVAAEITTIAPGEMDGEHTHARIELSQLRFVGESGEPQVTMVGEQPIPRATREPMCVVLELSEPGTERLLRLRFVCERPRRVGGFGGREVGLGWCNLRWITGQESRA